MNTALSVVFCYITAALVVGKFDDPYLSSRIPSSRFFTCFVASS